MAEPKTKERLLQAGEQLFAESGFSGTSLRQLTQLANVNLAAVNYHFGSKENLIREVFRRRLDGLYRQRSEAFDALVAEYGDPPPLRATLEAFIHPALAIGSTGDGNGNSFVRVLARAFVEYREELRQFLSENYGDVNRRFFHAMGAHLPELPADVLHGRIDFLIGSLTYAMADFGSRTPQTKEQHDEAVKKKARLLVDYTLAGLNAPP